MRILRVSDDLLLEIHDDGVFRLVSRDVARDREPDCAGAVVIYAAELDPLIAALMEVQQWHPSAGKTSPAGGGEQ